MRRNALRKCSSLQVFEWSRKSARSGVFDRVSLNVVIDLAVKQVSDPLILRVI
jgi:hypothetical protein